MPNTNQHDDHEKIDADKVKRHPEWMTREDIDRMLAKMDEEAIVEELEMERDIAEARRPRWWTFGIRTFVP